MSKKHTQLVTVEWHNAGAVVYRFESDEEITADRVAAWLVATEGFDDERDSATLHDDVDADFIDLDEPLPNKYRMTYECAKCDGMRWTMDWSCTCNDRCPICNTETEPLDYEDIPVES